MEKEPDSPTTQTSVEKEPVVSRLIRYLLVLLILLIPFAGMFCWED